MGRDSVWHSLRHWHCCFPFFIAQQSRPKKGEAGSSYSSRIAGRSRSHRYLVDSRALVLRFAA